VLEDEKGQMELTSCSFTFVPQKLLKLFSVFLNDKNTMIAVTTKQFQLIV